MDYKCKICLVYSQIITFSSEDGSILIFRVASCASKLFLIAKYIHNLQLNYIEVDVTGSRQKPESDAQRQSQDLGRVECSVVTPEENSDL